MALDEQVCAVVSANLEKKIPVGRNTDLRKDVHLDSFGTMMIINGLEDAFSISIDDQDFRAVSSVGDIIEMLRTKYHVGG